MLPEVWATDNMAAMDAKTDYAAMDTENLSASDSKAEMPVLKTTKDGIPLHPQPSDDPEDPLVC